jgi:hypothetical protein
MFKIFLSILSALISTSVGVATFTAVTTSRGEVTPVSFRLASHLTPGSPIPYSSWCNWHDLAMYNDDNVSCETIQGDGTLVHFSFSRITKQITRASFEVQNQTIGKLILAWGDPTAYVLHGTCIEVFWGNRSAWTIGAFSPASRAYFVEFYDVTPTDMLPWAGFITVIH